MYFLCLKEIFINWLRPPSDWCALNVDGAAKGSPGPAGGGAIIRNHCGEFISALVANFGNTNAFRAEAVALLRGLELARSLQIDKLLIQLDSLAGVQVIKSKNQGRNHVRCFELIDCPSWMVRITHVYREGNRAADWLANHGVTQHIGTHIFHSAPLKLHRILVEDASLVHRIRHA